MDKKCEILNTLLLHAEEQVSVLSQAEGKAKESHEDTLQALEHCSFTQKDPDLWKYLQELQGVSKTVENYLKASQKGPYHKLSEQMSPRKNEGGEGKEKNTESTNNNGNNTNSSRLSELDFPDRE